jgi:hypothetical protein
MTQPDIYTVEARRRIAAVFEDAGNNYTGNRVRDGECSLAEVMALAATLRELNWQSPVDPDEEGVRLAMVSCGWEDVETIVRAKLYSSSWKLALAAYRAGKAAGGVL